MIPSRLAAVVCAFSLSLFGCGGPGRLHILIPDFVSSSVDGLQLFRVVEKGRLRTDSTVAFGPITSTPTGLQMAYTQYVPGKPAWGPLQARVKRPGRGNLEIEMTVINAGAPSYFRVASYNERGASKPATGHIYVAGAQP